MLKAGAIFVVVAGAVWVTAPAAAVIVIEGELAVAEAAAAAASAASESVAAECSLLARAFSAIRGLSSVSRMQVVYGEVWMGAQSIRSEALDNRLLPSTSPRAIALNLAGMATGAAAGRLATVALAGRTGAALTATAATGASAIGGAVPQTADDWQRTGSFPVRSFAFNAAKGATSSVVSGNSKKLLTKFDKWKAIHHPRPLPGRHRAGRHRPSEG
jgi:gas vesicle protein